jgi:hypothetical protein
VAWYCDDHLSRSAGPQSSKRDTEGRAQSRDSAGPGRGRPNEGLLRPQAFSVAGNLRPEEERAPQGAAAVQPGMKRGAISP